jgi:outer membrane lipase/esterase
MKKRLLPALLVSLFAAAGNAGAAQFSNVYVFGDSLSDAGYYRPVLSALGLPSSVVSQMGRFTTNPGPVWSELIAQYYGVTPAPSNAGGTIYAQGGARVVGTPGVNTPTGFLERPISAQITENLAAQGGAADPNALYAVFGMGNDFFFQNAALRAGAITPAQFQQNILALSPAEVQQVGRLFQAGARHVMVLGPFDVTITPEVAALDPQTRAGLAQLSAGVNTTLWIGFASAGLRVIPVDLFSLMNEIRANPSAFGFTNITSGACGPFPPFTTTSEAFFCNASNLVAPNADLTYLFANPSGHFSTGGQRVIAQFAQAMIEGPYQYSFLAEAPLRTRALHVQGVSDGLSNGHDAELGKWTFFVSGGGGDFDVDAGIGNTGITNRNEAYTIGATLRTSPGVTLGGAYGQARTRGRLGADAGEFHTRDHSYSLFASARMGGFYGSGVLTLSEIDYSDIRRNIVLGALLRTANASTSGTNASAFLNAGYDFTLGRLRVGPTVSVTAQTVEVTGFDEGGAGSSNLRIFEQKRRSEVWSAGVRASADFAGWTPWIRVTADEERKDDPRFVTAMPLTLAATGNQYDIPAYAIGDSRWTTLAAGVRGRITPNVALGISYYNVSGRSGISEQGGNATLSVKF